ncbi:MAG TPA: hypothetical protein VGB45_03960 [Abditibacterium sp.]|jgi:hypothetical protein
MNSTWKSRPIPLSPLAVIARGAGALQLARRIVDRSDEELKTLRGVSSLSSQSPIIAILGEFETLPWADEAIYLGRDASPSLLLPTHLAPPFAPELLERALRKQFPLHSAPLAVMPMWDLVVPLRDALPLRRDSVEKWLQNAPFEVAK